MKTLKINTGEELILCDQSYDIVKNRKWKRIGKYVGRRTEGARKPCGGRTRPVEYIHRLITNAPKGMEVDHINRNPLDNRFSNLRLCTSSQNKYNRKSVGGSSKYKGVSFNKKAKKWAANIKENDKYVFLGYHEDEKEAALAYNEKAKVIHGEFVLLNEVGK